MTFIPAAHTAQCTFQYSQVDGSFAENVLYLEGGTDFTSSNLDTINTALQTWWETGDGTHSLKNLTAHDTTLVSITSRDMSTQTGPVEVLSVGEAGTNGDGSVALGLTWTVTFRSGLAGRSQRGRAYLVGMPSSFLSTEIVNGIDPTQAANSLDAWGSLIAAANEITIDSNPLNWVIRSTRHNNADRDASQLTNITSVGYHNLLVDFQRRRAPAHNRHH